MDVTEIKGIGPAFAENLKDGHGIETVQQLADHEGDTIDQKWIYAAKELLENPSEAEEPETFTFKFLLGFFANKDFKYRAGDPVFLYGTSVGNIQSARLQEVADDGVEGQKFKFFYSGEWSSAVMPEEDYARFKAAVNKQASPVSQPRLNVTTRQANAQPAGIGAAVGRVIKSGCKSCGK